MKCVLKLVTETSHVKVPSKAPHSTGLSGTSSQTYIFSRIITANCKQNKSAQQHEVKWLSRIPHTDELTQGCGVGLTDVKLSQFIDITLFDTQTKEKIKVFTED